jgi:hypothetical protein
MQDRLVDQDSPLSITSSVTGVLTFIVAIVAAAYVRFSYLRNSEDEYFRVKLSLSWYKTESTWMGELMRAAGEVERPGSGMTREQYRKTTEYQMYSFVMDQIDKLEERLLDIVKEVEVRSADTSTTDTFLPQRRSWNVQGAGKDHSADEGKWTFVPRNWSWKSKRSVALAWLPVRTRALELVRQRDALTTRLLFTQTSIISSYVASAYDGPPHSDTTANIEQVESETWSIGSAGSMLGRRRRWHGSRR